MTGGLVQVPAARASQAAGPVRLGHQPALDGLRACAVLAVMAYHSTSSPLPGGYLGVDVFFALSGFLITSVVISEWERFGAVDVRDFLRRRALRIMPALLLLAVPLTGYTLVARASNPEAVRVVDRALVAMLTFSSNWFEAASPDTLHMYTPVWSLAVEVQFYLTWPLLLVWLLRRGCSRARILSVTVALIAASVTTCAVLLATGASHARVYYGSDTRASELLLGALAGLLTMWRAWPAVPWWPLVRRTVAVATAVGLAAFAALSHPTHSAVVDVVGLPLAAAGAAVLVSDLLASGGGPLGRLLRWRPLVEVGLLSYALFLWHTPLYALVSPQRFGVSGPVSAGLSLLLPFVVAALSYHFVEAPVLRRTRRPRREVPHSE